MLILNFSHPLTEEQKTQIEALTGQAIAEVRAIPSQMDNARPFAGQIEEMVRAVGLSSAEWQTRPLLINPPAYNFAAVTLTAYLHGLMGYFPPVVRLRPVPEATPPRFEVAEIINLQAVRDAARRERDTPNQGEKHAEAF